jgi:hypothetical protein
MPGFDFSAAMQRFGQGYMDSLGGDLGNTLSGYRDMRGQIVDTQQKQASTEDLSAHAEHQRMVNASEKRQAQILQQQAQKRQQLVSGAQQQVQTMIEQGAALIAGGEPAAGGALIEKAALIESHLATARREEDVRKQQEFSRNQETRDFEDRLWVGIKNQSDMAAAAAQWTERFPGQANPFNGFFDPAKRDERVRTTRAGGDFQKNERAQQELEERIKNYKRLREVSQKREQYDDEMLKIRKEQAAKSAKDGVVKGAPPELQAKGEDYVRDNFDNLPAKEVRQFGWEIADRAMAIQSANRGLSQGEALKIAAGEKQRELKLLNDHYTEEHSLLGGISRWLSPPAQLPEEGEVTPGAKPIMGSVWDGHRYIGGDPSKKTSWVPAESDEGPDAVDAETGEAVSPEDVKDW